MTGQPQRPLILLAHGSRHRDSSRLIDELARRTAARSGLVVDAAYLDLCAPDLGTVAARLATARFTDAVVVPLLFTTAYHAKVDLPAAVAAAAAASGLGLTIAPILGTGPDVVETLATHALTFTATHPGGAGEYVLYAVGSSDQEAVAAIRQLGVDLARRLGTPVCTVFATGGITPLPPARPGRVLIPVFTTHGLLLDQAQQQLPSAGPLGPALAQVVLERYRQAPHCAAVAA